MAPRRCRRRSFPYKARLTFVGRVIFIRKAPDGRRSLAGGRSRGPSPGIGVCERNGADHGVGTAPPRQPTRSRTTESLVRAREDDDHAAGFVDDRRHGQRAHARVGPLHDVQEISDARQHLELSGTERAVACRDGPRVPLSSLAFANTNDRLGYVVRDRNVGLPDTASLATHGIDAPRAPRIVT
jgi:hypothetical protein